MNHKSLLEVPLLLAVDIWSYVCSKVIYLDLKQNEVQHNISAWKTALPILCALGCWRGVLTCHLSFSFSKNHCLGSMHLHLQGCWIRSPNRIICILWTGTGSCHDYLLFISHIWTDLDSPATSAQTEKINKLETHFTLFINKRKSQ